MRDQTEKRSSDASRPIVLSIDAMGGDLGPAMVVSGMNKAARRNARLRYILHGPRAKLDRLIARRKHLAGRVEIRDCASMVRMDDKPSQVVRAAQGTSMWSAIEALREKEAEVAVSCGNTGALMALSMLRLERLPGVPRPAIAVFWPSRNRQKFNIVLDAGADLRADPEDLLRFALMGSACARNGLNVKTPRIGLLNVGTEAHKGHSNLRAAHDLIASHHDAGGFRFAGFVEGDDIPGDNVDVVVTDGFTGNVAVKTGEGTASYINDLLRGTFRQSPLAHLAAFLVHGRLRRLRHRIDPRRVNGGIFLGLRGTVVKSHGAADATGIAAAIKLAADLSARGLNDQLIERIALIGENTIAARRKA